MIKKKVSHVTETVVLDKETGEVATMSKTSTYSVEGEPPFIKLYINAVAKLSGLPDGSKSTLFELIKLVDYDGRIILNAGIKRIIAKNIGVKPHTIANTLTQLIKSNIISRIDTGIYLMNPFYFARGKWNDIMKSRINYVKISMMYSERGEEISIETSMNEQQEHPDLLTGCHCLKEV